MQKTFQEIVVGQAFKFNNQQYVKMNTVKVSCCKSANCYVADNHRVQHFIRPDQKVEVSD